MYEAVYSLGIDAAWRLQEWGTLESMLASVNKVESKLSAEYLIDDAFIISSSKLIVNLFRNHNEDFKGALYKARLSVSIFVSPRK